MGAGGAPWWLGLLLLLCFGFLTWKLIRFLFPGEDEEEREEEDQEGREREREIFYKNQLALARKLKRTDQEIEEWARRNFKTILANERVTLAEVEKKLAEWGEYLRARDGDEIIEWWLEPLKEIKYAKRFVIEEGEFLDQLRRRLQEEELEARVLAMRQRILKELELDQEAPEVELIEPERRPDGILGRIIQAIRGH